jgi:hypothetical protein
VQLTRNAVERFRVCRTDQRPCAADFFCVFRTPLLWGTRSQDEPFHLQFLSYLDFNRRRPKGNQAGRGRQSKRLDTNLPICHDGNIIGASLRSRQIIKSRVQGRRSFSQSAPHNPAFTPCTPPPPAEIKSATTTQGPVD